MLTDVGIVEGVTIPLSACSAESICIIILLSCVSVSVSSALLSSFKLSNDISCGDVNSNSLRGLGLGSKVSRNGTSICVSKSGG